MNIEKKVATIVKHDGYVLTLTEKEGQFLKAILGPVSCEDYEVSKIIYDICQAIDSKGPFYMVGSKLVGEL